MLDQNNHVLNIFCDGGARGNPGPAACAFVAMDLHGQEIFHHELFLGKSTNNYAEYSAVIEALRWLSNYSLNTSIHKVCFYLDSLLVVNQIIGVYKVKDSGLKDLYTQVKELLLSIKSINIEFNHILRTKNFRADYLVNLALDKQPTT